MSRFPLFISFISGLVRAIWLQLVVAGAVAGCDIGFRVCAPLVVAVVLDVGNITCMNVSMCMCVCRYATTC